LNSLYGFNSAITKHGGGDHGTLVLNLTFVKITHLNMKKIPVYYLSTMKSKLLNNVDVYTSRIDGGSLAKNK